MRILIAGGAGFVGSHLAFVLKERLGCHVTVLDNLKRRGSESNLTRLKREGIEFFHGDIRLWEDLEVLPGYYDLLIEASAEPSVAAGQDTRQGYVLQTNVTGTLNCLEFARKRAGALLFLSTSRVYPIALLRAVNLEEKKKRYEIAEEQELAGMSVQGISEEFPMSGGRSVYGATKLASELMISEYSFSFKLPTLIDRCGVIAGPGQFGRVDQGVFTYWVGCHYFGRPLRYTGFGGKGKQVRDILHPLDLALLIERQVERQELWKGQVYNVGGGKRISVSLREMTDLCREIVGREVSISEELDTAPYDVPLYISNHEKVSAEFGWVPQKTERDIVSETASWISENERCLKGQFECE